MPTVLKGLMAPQPQARPLRWDDVSGILHRGGTILGTSNSANPLKDAATLAQVQANVQALGLQVVVAIGGDGTMSLAHGVAQATGMHCVGVPKTIDNDIAHCERSFGFDTAVATVTEALAPGRKHGQQPPPRDDCRNHGPPRWLVGAGGGAGRRGRCDLAARDGLRRARHRCHLPPPRRAPALHHHLHWRRGQAKRCRPDRAGPCRG